MIPTTPLPVHTPLMPSQSIEVSLPLNTIGPVMKMDPLNNLQVRSTLALCLVLSRAPVRTHARSVLSINPPTGNDKLQICRYCLNYILCV